MPTENNILDSEVQTSSKSYTIAVALSAIFGVLGIQHFYIGRYDMGFLDLGLSIGAVLLFVFDYPLYGVLLVLIDFVHTVIVTYLLLVGKFKDGDGNLITYPGQKLN